MKLDKIKEWKEKIEKHKKKRTEYKELVKQESSHIKALSNNIYIYKIRGCQENNI